MLGPCLKSLPGESLVMTLSISISMLMMIAFI